jgi:hypothetical protein
MCICARTLGERSASSKFSEHVLCLWPTMYVELINYSCLIQISCSHTNTKLITMINLQAQGGCAFSPIQYLNCEGRQQSVTVSPRQQPCRDQPEYPTRKPFKVLNDDNDFCAKIVWNCRSLTIKTCLLAKAMAHAACHAQQKVVGVNCSCPAAGFATVQMQQAARGIRTDLNPVGHARQSAELNDHQVGRPRIGVQQRYHFSLKNLVCSSLSKYVLSH